MSKDQRLPFTDWLCENTNKQQNERDILGVYNRLIRLKLSEKDARDIIEEVLYCMMDEYGD